MKIEFKDDGKMIWRGATRILWSQEYDQHDYLEIPEVIDFENSFDSLAPWRDFGASKLGPSAVVTEKSLNHRKDYLRIPLAENSPPHIDPYVKFSLVLITQSGNGSLKGVLIKDCTMKSVSYPERLHEQISIMVEIYFETMEALEPFSMTQDANT